MNYMEEDKAVRNFIIVFVIVLLLVVGVYFFTVFVNKDNEPKTDDTNTTEEVQIDKTKAIVGTMLNKSDKEYYVILYKSDDDKASDYQGLVTKYKNTKNALSVYTVDLADGFNSKYYDKDNTNYTSSNLEDLRFGDITVLQIKNNKIAKSFNTVDKIKKEFKIS